MPHIDKTFLTHGDRHPGTGLRHYHHPVTTQTPRFDTIDVLRGLSILAVVLLHTWLRLYFGGVHVDANLPRLLAHLLFRNGGNGVTVFFAISGFLIAFTSLRRFGTLAAMRPLTFYRIRFARIAPLLLTLLAVLSVLHLAHVEAFVIRPNVATLPRALLAALTFHLNIYEAAHGYLPPNWDVLWSLSIEEMFYLFFPLVCLATIRWRHGLSLFATILLALVAMGPFARTTWYTDEVWRENNYLAGMSDIAVGCLAALLTHRLWPSRDSLRRSLIPIQILGAAMIFLIALWPPHQPILRFLGKSGLDDTALALATSLVMLASVLRNRPGRPWTAPLRWFGRHSYEVYLTHEFLVVFGTELYLKYRRGPVALWVIAILLLTAPLGALVAHLLSEPLNRRLRPKLDTIPPLKTRDANPA
jgi:peptidoglycan/LPS O-acetylase OafA/YrhL